MVSESSLPVEDIFFVSISFLSGRDVRIWMLIVEIGV